MGQANEFAAISLIVRQAASVMKRYKYIACCRAKLSICTGDEIKD
jgi:hypothetical protein